MCAPPRALWPEQEERAQFLRRDLEAVTVPALIIHGSGDGTVPFEGSGKRTHEQLSGSELVLIEDAPHGLNVSHAGPFNDALLAFLAK